LIRSILLGFGCCLLLGVSFGQEKEKKIPKWLQPDPPAYLSIDTSEALLEEDIDNEYLEDPFDFDETHDNVANDPEVRPDKRVVVESYPKFKVVVDTVQGKVVYDTVKLNPLVQKHLADSSYWLGIDSAFAIFDSMSVNPYKIDGAKFKDTLIIQLHDTVPSLDMRWWCMPIDPCYVTSKFGQRGYRWHYGTDLRLKIGDSVKAAFDGVVRISKYNPGGYGNYVLIRHHNGFETLYGHLTKQLVSVGEEVKAGDLIGWGGNTGRSSGPHLHFEVRYHGNAIDPQSMFNFDSCSLITSTFELNPKHFKYIKDRKEAVYHRIRSGDTLSQIARKYRVSMRQICRLNGITPNTILRIGRSLRIR
jgi:murein DD-endopeptidase MepM/ murein hydrolase activator NlpD